MTIDHEFIPTPVTDEFMKTTSEDFYNSVLNEDLLGKIVRTQIHIEAVLNALIEMRLYDYSALEKHNLDFEISVSLAFALGLNTSLKGPLKNLSKIRNRFAHRLDAKLDKGDMNNLFKSFSSEDRQLITTHFKKVRQKQPKNEKGEPRPESHSAMNPGDRFALYAATLRAALLAGLKQAERLEYYQRKGAEALGMEWKSRKKL